MGIKYRELVCREGWRRKKEVERGPGRERYPSISSCQCPVVKPYTRIFCTSGHSVRCIEEKPAAPERQLPSAQAAAVWSPHPCCHNSSHLQLTAVASPSEPEVAIFSFFHPLASCQGLR